MKNLKFHWLILLITFTVSFALTAKAQTKKPRKKAKVTNSKVTVAKNKNILRATGCKTKTASFPTEVRQVIPK